MRGGSIYARTECLLHQYRYFATEHRYREINMRRTIRHLCRWRFNTCPFEDETSDRLALSRLTRLRSNARGRQCDCAEAQLARVSGCVPSAEPESGRPVGR